MVVLSDVVVWLFLFVPVLYLLRQFVSFYTDFKKRSKCLLKITGPPPHWLWGHLLYFPGPTEAGFNFLQETVKDMPRGSRTFYGRFIAAASFWHPDPLKTILKTAEPKPLRFGGYRFIKPWLGDGLLISHGRRWARNRRLLTPAFHFDTLKPYLSIYNRCTDVMLDKLENFAKDDKYFEVFNQISQLTLDILFRCAFSSDNDIQIRGSNHPYLQAVTEIGITAVARMLKPWLYPDLIFNLTSMGRKFRKNCDYVHHFADDVIKARKLTLENQVENKTKSKYRDFLDILLTARDESGQGLTDLEIRNEVDTFMFEGHDTTSSGISWALYLLAKNKEAQRKCQEEIDLILQDRDSDEILWEDLPHLQYLSLCIKESLRMYPPVPLITRETTRDTRIDGHEIPAGTNVDIHLFSLHHNQEVWGDDDLEFKPERMTQERMNKMDTFAYLPFSAGPRNCIGQHFALHEMKVVIARILRRFDLDPDPFHVVERRLVIVLKSENGIHVKARLRRGASTKRVSNH